MRTSPYGEVFLHMEKLGPDHAGHLLELLEDRYQTSSKIMISQLPVKEWYNMIGNATRCESLLNRLYGLLYLYCFYIQL